MEAHITVIRSDGAKELSPGEVDTLLISGMGGALICRILTESRKTAVSAGELVLSPQSEPFLVRHLVQELGFAIDREEMLTDQGKYYVILHAVPGIQQFDREEEYIYGNYLIYERNPVLLHFLEKEKGRVTDILKGFEQKKLSESALSQKKGLEESLARIQWTMERMTRL